jgi:hypothetical protein
MKKKGGRRGDRFAEISFLRSQKSRGCSPNPDPGNFLYPRCPSPDDFWAHIPTPNAKVSRTRRVWMCRAAALSSRPSPFRARVFRLFVVKDTGIQPLTGLTSVRQNCGHKSWSHIVSNSTAQAWHPLQHAGTVRKPQSRELHWPTVTRRGSTGLRWGGPGQTEVGHPREGTRQSVCCEPQ